MRKTMIILAAALMLVGCNQGKSNTEVAGFNGGNLTIEDLAAHRNKMAKDSKFKNNPETMTKEFVFDHALNMEMIIAKGLKEKLHLDPVIREELHSHMADLFLKVLQKKLVPEFNRKEITEAEAKAYYDTNKTLYQIKPLYTVSLIRVADPKRASEIFDDIKTSAISFEKAALTLSDDKKSAQKEGKIGQRSLARFKPNWQTPISTLTLGKVSQPIEIDDAWYLFKLNHKTKPGQYSFEEKKQYIINDVLYEKYRNAWNKAYGDLKQEFRLNINHENLEKFYQG